MRNKDLKFLKEMQARMNLGFSGDRNQFTFVQKMIVDWIDDLTGKQSRTDILQNKLN